MKGIMNMKKNAALVAGILFVAGCASSQGQRAGYSTYDSSSHYDRADVSVSSTEHVERAPNQSPRASADIDVSTAVSGDTSAGYSRSYSDADESYGGSGEYYSGTSSSIKADSSIRGGSLDARGYDQEANNDEIEGPADAINPGKQADSSIRGGSIYAREREWNHDAEPSSGTIDQDRQLKADSSVRGGSIEARGGREAGSNDYSDAQSGFNAEAHIDAAQKNDSRDDFGQGSSATWESDKAHGSVRGSANWNPSDDLMPDGQGSDHQAGDLEGSYQINSDASVGGAARSESGVGASSHDEGDHSSASVEADLNASNQLERNISGEYDVEKQQQSRISESGVASSDSIGDTEDINSRDSLSTSSSSLTTTDIYHGEEQLTAETDAQQSGEMEVEAVGASAGSEVGESSSSEEFESNDPALNNTGSPLGTSGNEPNFLYEDNRAQGVGSAASGEFARSPVNQGAELEADRGDLAAQVKQRLTQESTGKHGLMTHQVARNVQVSAEGGEITLKGTVPSEKDKNMIEVRAREIRGVTKVNNQLIVAPEADVDGREISRGSDLEDVTSGLQSN
jgi:hypothetical protein